MQSYQFMCRGQLCSIGMAQVFTALGDTGVNALKESLSLGKIMTLLTSIGKITPDEFDALPVPEQVETFNGFQEALKSFLELWAAETEKRTKAQTKKTKE